MPVTPQSRRHRWARSFAAIGLLTTAAVLWGWWAGRHPEHERQLRVQLQDQLESTFPAPRPSGEDRYGIFPRVVGGHEHHEPHVVLVHGLDEPGGVWADLLPALDAVGFKTWEFRYPNDQGIDRSTDLLASCWSSLPASAPIVLIGHSMGGLVIRDFVSRWRHPVGHPTRVDGASVLGVILVGTPNHGSEWARVRVWLEPRDQWAASRQSGFSPLAGLRDGTGAAKIDLTPGSRFLEDLNARPWPESVQVGIIGGVLSLSTPALGDGVVTTESLNVAGAPAPTLVVASHRGMLTAASGSEGEPPAIPIIVTLLEAFGENHQRRGPAAMPLPQPADVRSAAEARQASATGSVSCATLE